MLRRILVLANKILIRLLRLAGKNGSALPGLIIERLDPSFLTHVLKDVENQIVLVTGTNGKTTTTKMLVTALRASSKKVVTNTTGSNMTRGLISALVEDMTYLGSLKPTDWFVFEMDEAYAPIFTRTISPKILVALNVLRDQLDRYGELDKTAQLIAEAALNTDNFIYSALDPLLKSVAEQLVDSRVTTYSFGIDNSLISHVENEQSLYGGKVVTGKNTLDAMLVKAEPSEDIQSLTIKTRKKKYEFVIPLEGFHNALNATAVLATLEVLNHGSGVDSLATMSSPFGRGEKLHSNGKTITVALVKNPSGFMSNLETFIKQGEPEIVLFVVNDKFADGRDVSWLWDVNFAPFLQKNTKLVASGIRAYDIALRLKHDGFDSDVKINIPSAIETIMNSPYKKIVIIPTYTALFEVRSALSRYGKVPRIW